MVCVHIMNKEPSPHIFTIFDNKKNLSINRAINTIKKVPNTAKIKYRKTLFKCIVRISVGPLYTQNTLNIPSISSLLSKQPNLSKKYPIHKNEVPIIILENNNTIALKKDIVSVLQARDPLE